MTNADKYLKEGVSVEEFIEALTYELSGWDNKTYSYGMEDTIRNALNKPTTPTLTEDERVILRNIPKDHTKIRRSTYKDKICGKELAPIEIVDEKGKYYTLYILSHLFQFIKERRRI